MGEYIQNQEYWLLGGQRGAIGALPAHGCNPPPAIAISPNCCLLGCKVLHIPFNQHLKFDLDGVGAPEENEINSQLILTVFAKGWKPIKLPWKR